MKQYKIKKGKHYSNRLNLPIPYLRLNKSFNYKFIIEADNLNNDAERQDDWNKLSGIGVGLSARSNSIRAAWRFNKDKSTFEWCIFREVNKEFVFSEFIEGATCTVIYDKEGDVFSINVNGNAITYVLSEEPDSRKILDANILLELQPYFGGDASADADYTITRY